MKILVTGGAGYVGSVCVARLLDEGHEVVVFDNLGTGHRAAVDPRARLIVGDLCAAGVIDAAVGRAAPEAIMHFAAHSLVGESMTDASKYLRNNVGGGVNLLDAAVRHGVGRLVFSSSCAVFGVPDELPIHEDLPKAPLSTYGETKLIFEQMLAWCERVHGLCYTALRYFNAAGATATLGEHHHPETHLIPIVLRVAQGRRENVAIFGDDYPTDDGTCVRDYIHVADLADAHLSALSVAGSGAYNLGSEVGCSVREVIEACRRVTGHPIPTVERARRPGDPPRLVAASDRAHRELGWSATRGLEEVVASAWEWHQAHPGGYSEPAS